MADSRLTELEKIKASTGGLNPVQNSEYEALRSQYQASQPQAAPVVDPIAQAQKFLEFQKTANQPVVQQLEASKAPLEQKYQDLVASIKGTGKVAQDRQTLATNNELGRRGILPTSGLYEQEQANAALPLQAQIASQLAQTGMAQNDDLTKLALQIAQLQAGNPSDAISGALNYGNQVQSANQFAQDLAYRQQQSQADNEYRSAALAAQNQPQSPYVTLGEGSTLFDLLNGRALYTAPKQYKATGGGGGDPLGLL